MRLMLILSFVLVSAGQLPEAAKKELKLLQGEWVAEQFENYREKIDFKELGKIYLLEIKGNKWIFAGQEKAEIVALD